MQLEIEIGEIKDALKVDANIPEFSTEIENVDARINTAINTETTSTREAQMQTRLAGKTTLILVAKVDGKLAGYKIGYQISGEIFYSWLGAVLPEYRRLGIARALREYQESWAINAGYSEINVKSMNCFPAMLQMLIASGYHIYGYEQSEQGSANSGAGKILFRKVLKTPR